MLLLIRVLIILIYSLLVCLFGIVYCLFSPRKPSHVALFGHLFARLAPWLGIKVVTRLPAPVSGKQPPSLYIANHQNNFDMVTTAKAVQTGTVTVGKKSLLWVPFFGPLYWITGNILIEREKRNKAHSTIMQVVEQIKLKQLSVWMFPEGTRSYGRGLLPFKTGAFHVAIKANIPIIPICVSTTHNKIKLNRWNNGYVIVEMLAPIPVEQYAQSTVRDLADYCQQLMQNKIAQLDAEVTQLEQQR